MNPSHHQFVAHPWHGIYPFKPNFAEFSRTQCLKAFIEMTASDDVKLEVDKVSGHLLIDRPNKFSNQLPCMYGFIPQTYCHHLTAKLANQDLKARGYDTTDCSGDLDPLDICVFTDRQIHSGVLAQAKVIGGLCMIDSGEIDDKIIAVLKDDAVYGDCHDINELPQPALAKILHYFLTYKEQPTLASEPTKPKKIEITHTYSNHHAIEVIQQAHQDYLNAYSTTSSPH